MDKAELYEKMTEKVLLKGSKIIPQLFAMIADEDEGKTLLAMPGTPEDLAAKMGTTPEVMKKRCETLYHKGLAFKSFKGGAVGYKMCRDLVQFHDATILWPEAPRAYLDLWQRYMEEEWPAYAKMISKVMPKPFTRIIPAGIDLDARQQVLPFESVQSLIDKAERLSVTDCTCRKIAHKCDAPVNVCLQLNKSADYSIDRGTGRELTKKQALDIIKIAEDAGLIHMTMNKSDAGHFICNCCDDCCQTFPILIKQNIITVDPSRFYAKVDAEACTACEICLDRCHFGAIEMKDVNGKRVSVISQEKCMGCGLCRTTCEDEAITLVEVRQRTFVPGAQ